MPEVEPAWIKKLFEIREKVREGAPKKEAQPNKEKEDGPTPQQ